MQSVCHCETTRKWLSLLATSESVRVRSKDLHRIGGAESGNLAEPPVLWRRNLEALDPLEWLARMSDHISDPGQHRTILYGVYANRVRGGRQQIESF